MNNPTPTPHDIFKQVNLSISATNDARSPPVLKQNERHGANQQSRPWPPAVRGGGARVLFRVQNGQTQNGESSLFGERVERGKCSAHGAESGGRGSGECTESTECEICR